MRRLAFAASLALVALLALQPSSRAARDIAVDAGSGVELIVFEVDGCIYCRVFRRDVLPTYQASPRAKEVPIRFVDLNAADDGKLALAGPVDVVPTAVLLKGNREVGRIPGYVGPESFFHSVSHLLSRAQ